MYKNVDIANSQFVGLIEPRLVKRQAILTGIIMDPEALDYEIVDAAHKRREVKDLLEVFTSVRELGLDPSGMTAAEILEMIMETSIESLQKQSGGGVLAQDIVEKSQEVAASTINATKKGLNSFASWLANKTK